MPRMEGRDLLAAGMLWEKDARGAGLIPAPRSSWDPILQEGMGGAVG